MIPMRTISGPDGREYLRRYYLLGHGGPLKYFPGSPRPILGWLPFTIYLHRFEGPDWHRSALHDHPSDGLSIGLWGGYVERRLVRGTLRWITRRAPFVSVIRTTTWHRIHRLLGRVTWTVFIVSRAKKSWSFWDPPGEAIPWREFLAQTHEVDHAD